MNLFPWLTLGGLPRHSRISRIHNHIRNDSLIHDVPSIGFPRMKRSPSCPRKLCRGSTGPYTGQLQAVEA